MGTNFSYPTIKIGRREMWEALKHHEQIKQDKSLVQVFRSRRESYARQATARLFMCFFYSAEKKEKKWNILLTVTEHDLGHHHRSLASSPPARRKNNMAEMLPGPYSPYLRLSLPAKCPLGEGSAWRLS